jgi:UDP-N-acetylmuramyl pentapeptide synthase
VFGFGSVAEARAALYEQGLLVEEDTILIKASRGMGLEALLQK